MGPPPKKKGRARDSVHSSNSILINLSQQMTRTNVHLTRPSQSWKKVMMTVRALTKPLQREVPRKLEQVLPRLAHQ